jgi:SpoVK/Ycf46/Vps4 family AAA+-type ATPase
MSCNGTTRKSHCERSACPPSLSSLKTRTRTRTQTHTDRHRHRQTDTHTHTHTNNHVDNTLHSAAPQGLQLSPDVSLVSVAERCHGYTGADLKGVVGNAQLEAAHESLSNANEAASSRKATPTSDGTTCGSSNAVKEVVVLATGRTGKDGAVPTASELARARMFACASTSPNRASGVGSSRSSTGGGGDGGGDASMPLSHASDDAKSKTAIESDGSDVSTTSPGVVLTSSHFDRAVRAVRPSVTAEEQARYLRVHAEMSGTTPLDHQQQQLTAQRATLA